MVVGNTYELKDTLVTEYEWDKGPRPSGYAQLRLRLQPRLLEDESGQVTTSPGQLLTIRPTEYAKKRLLSEAEISAFIAMAIKGVQEGSKQALTQFLDRPVPNVLVVLEQITVDLMYSTEMAFRIASRSAVEKLLKQALDEGLITLSPGN
jgi:hypothetical protein